MNDRLHRYIPLAARLLIAVPFIYFALYKLANWTMIHGWLQAIGLPVPGLLLGLAIFTEFVAGLMLLAGFLTRFATLWLALYLIPVHLLLHNFWAIQGPDRQGQIEQFLKGLMIIGGLLYVYRFGSGAVSVDDSDIAADGAAQLEEMP